MDGMSRYEDERVCEFLVYLVRLALALGVQCI